MRTMSFFVVGDPVPNSRVRPSQTGAVKPDRRYDSWLRCIERAARKARSATKFDVIVGSCRVEMHFRFRRKHEAKPLAAQPMEHTDPPDNDNLAKGVLDAMERAGYFARSDGQANDTPIRKTWAESLADVGVLVNVIAFPDLSRAGTPMKRKPSKKPSREIDRDPDSVEFTRR